MLWVDSTAASASPFSKLSIYNTRQNTSRRQLVALPRRVGATKSDKPRVPRFIKFSSVYVCVCVPKLISGAGWPVDFNHIYTVSYKSIWWYSTYTSQIQINSASTTSWSNWTRWPCALHAADSLAAPATMTMFSGVTAYAPTMYWRGWSTDW